MSTDKFELPTSRAWVELCKNDGEFLLAARTFDGGIKLSIGDAALNMTIRNGIPAAGNYEDSTRILEYTGSEAAWAEVLAVTPKRYCSDLLSNMFTGQGLGRTGDDMLHAQYYGAVKRSVELLRPAESPSAPLVKHKATHGVHDSPVGRYINLELADGHVYRIYYEEAGDGIPLLLQHTAGCNSVQWRHLMEMPDITNKFRLIAYDVPFHGKSVPPTGKKWWAEQYKLSADVFRSVPVQLSKALDLDNPVFMGCSFGGLLALDLAYHHADLFRAVISLEGMLVAEGSMNDMLQLSHPQIGDDYQARVVEGYIAPRAPMPYRKETTFIQSAGWSQVLLGDTYYFFEDYDLSSLAREIDTDKVEVHVLNGEYDYTGTVEKGLEVHQAIKGSTFTEMKGIGHFPISENPVEFVEYVMPVLTSIAAKD